MLTLFHTPTACSLASWLALEEAGADYEVSLVDLADRDAYRRLHPRGTVPALAVGGEVIGENLAIMTYVADSHPGAGLLATGPLERARQLSRLSWMSSTVHINRRRARMPVRFVAGEDAQAAVREAGRPAFWENLKEIDGQYRGGGWQFDRFGLADCYALVFFHWGYLDRQPMDELEAYSDFIGRARLRPAVARVLERDGNVLARADL